MAQTIAAQRGSTTVSANGTTNVTLFTQSSGTARVILNSLSCWTTNGGTQPKAALLLNSNSSGVYLPIAFQTIGSTAAIGGLTFFPGQSPAYSGQIPSSAAGEPNSFVPVSSASSAVAISLASGNTTMVGLTGNTSSDSNFCFSTVPSTFWLNSGDSLVFRCYFFRSPFETATVLYSFTTITET